MKQMKRAAGLILAIMMFCSMALSGCQQKLEPADQVVGALYELALKDNAVPMKDLLGFASEDDVRAAIMEDGYENSMIDEIRSEFTSFGVEISDEELQAMIDTMMGMLDKLTYTAEIKEQTKDKTTVVLKVKGFSEDDVQQVLMDTQNEAIANLSEDDQMALATGDEQATQDFAVQFMKDYIANVAKLEPAEGENEITVECEKLRIEVSGKEKVEWLPSDMDKFAEDVDASIFK